MTSLSRRTLLMTSLAGAALPLGAHAAARLSAEAPPSELWDLTELYPDDVAWEAERQALLTALGGLASYKGKLGDSGSTLKAGLQAISDLNRRFGRFYTYAGLKADEDLTSGSAQERRQQADDVAAQLSEASAFVEPELIALGATKIEALLAAETGLAKFSFYLKDTLRRAAHTLDARGEALLAQASNPLTGAEGIRSQLVLSDIPWPQVTLASGPIRLDNQGYVAARSRPDRAERKLVFDTVFSTYKTYESTLGAALTTKVKSNIFVAKARGFSSALESALSQGNVPTAVYKTLIAEANRGLPVLHRYFEIRRRLLKLPDLCYYDIYPPVTKLDRRFTLAESRQLTLAAVEPLGADYVARLAKASSSRWMNAMPRKGKASGAYMNPGAYDVHPYLLLNHTEDYTGMTTFAHEWGHAMHSVLANANQPFETADYRIFTAEIPSTMNEHLLSAYMLKGAKTPAETLFYLDRVCELIRGTFFRQTMFAEFELLIHERIEAGDALSGEKLSSLYLELLRKYHGPKVEVDAKYATEWAYIQHFYYNFYVFQYATCVSASAYFSENVLKGGKTERDNYLKVLKAGGSDYPTEVIKAAGLDMTKPDPYRAVVAKLSQTLDQMEPLLAGA